MPRLGPGRARLIIELRGISVAALGASHGGRPIGKHEIVPLHPIGGGDLDQLALLPLANLLGGEKCPMPLGIGTWSGGGKACGYANWNVGFIRQPGCDSPGCRINSAFRWCCEDAPARTFLSHAARNWDLVWRVSGSELRTVETA